LTHPPETSEDFVADFTRLRVWQAAHSLVLFAYRATSNFPADERFGLTSQIRRAAVSIGANIAEACGRYHKGDQARFILIAKGSTKEVRNHLMIARDLGFMSADQQQSADVQLIQIERMLSALLRAAHTS
jgi:four helix bundle protein